MNTKKINKIRVFTLISVMTILLMVRLIQIHDASRKNKLCNSNYNVIKVGRLKTSGWEMNSRESHHHVFVDFNSDNIQYIMPFAIVYKKGNTLLICRRVFILNLSSQIPVIRAEPVFVSVYGAQESIPKNRFRQCSLAGLYDNRIVVPARQAGNRFLGSLRGLQIQALEFWNNLWGLGTE